MIVHLKIISYYLNEKAVTDLEMKRKAEFKNSSEKATVLAVPLTITLSSQTLR